MPEPRGPQEGEENLTSGEAKPGSNIDQETQKANQGRPEDKDRYARAQRKDEEQDGAEDVVNVEDVEEVEGTGDAEDLDDAEDAGDVSDSSSDKEQTDKQAGRMLNPKNPPEDQNQ